MLVQHRVTGGQTLAAAPEAHALQELRRGAHPAGRFSHWEAPGARTRRPGARASWRWGRHAKPAHVPDPALDLRPRRQ
eukprot:4128239-Alexandrium_andersonii.AAC.1